MDYRPGAGIRLAPHFYTQDEELERTIAEVQEILRTRAYENTPLTNPPSIAMDAPVR